MMSCSILSSDAGLLEYATQHEIVKFTLHWKVLEVIVPMVSNSKYGESGTTTTAGTGTDSGTYENTFAETPARAVASGCLTAERIVDAAIIVPLYRCQCTNREAPRID